MTKILVIVLLAVNITSGFEGPDFMLSGDLYIPRNKVFNLSSVPDGYSGVSAIFRSSSLYGIKSLNWTYAGVKINSETGTLAVSFRNYGYKELYSSTELLILLQKSVFKKASIGIGYSHKGYEYGNDYKDDYDIFSLSTGVDIDPFSLSLSVVNLSIKKRDFNNNQEIVAAVNWKANKILNIYSLFYRDSRKHKRISIGQDLIVHESIVLNAGLISNPEIYYAGFEIVYNRLIFGYTFYSIGGLPDCARLTLSFR